MRLYVYHTYRYRRFTELRNVIQIALLRIVLVSVAARVSAWRLRCALRPECHAAYSSAIYIHSDDEVWEYCILSAILYCIHHCMVLYVQRYKAVPVRYC